ncbi:MAG TPA: YceI family protein [Candidatus Paceibacterota bacterium]
MKKTITWIIVLLAIGAGAFLYLTRPVKVEDSSTTAGVESELSADNKKGETLYRINKEQSTAKFTIKEDLRGEPFTVVGTTNDISGDVVLKTEGKAELTIGTILIDVRTFKTDNANRDGAINRLIVQTGTEGHEYAVLTNTSVSGLPETITVGTPFTFEVTGDLMLAGIKKPATFAVTATQNEGSLSGTLSSTLKRSDYKLVIPNIPFVANVSDDFVVSADFVAVAQ